MYPDINISDNIIVFCPWDEFEVYGCMYEDALNYDELATIDDGSCEYEPCPIYGCMNPIACNYNQYATLNQGCVFCDTLVVRKYVMNIIVVKPIGIGMLVYLIVKKRYKNVIQLQNMCTILLLLQYLK